MSTMFLLCTVVEDNGCTIQIILDKSLLEFPSLIQLPIVGCTLSMAQNLTMGEVYRCAAVS